MAAQAKPEPKPEAPALVKFRLSRMWSTDKGLFLAGSEIEVAESVAESLMDEDMGDLA